MTATEELCELLREVGATVTFSANCRSGLTRSCQDGCCAGVEREDEDPAWADEARTLSELFAAGYGPPLEKR